MSVIVDEKSLTKIGFKKTYEENDKKFYARFGYVFIELVLYIDGRWEIKHNRYYPEVELINEKARELVSEEDSIQRPQASIVLNAKILKEIVQWIDDCAKDDDEQFDEEEEVEMTYDDKMNIPEVKCDKTRQLKIYVWGRRRRKKVPGQYNIDHNFNACVLHGKKSGVDWRKDGREDAIRNAVMKGRLFPSFMETMVKYIESEDMHSIGINCSKGRHRSVTCAIVLKTYFFPETEIVFLELK